MDRPLDFALELIAGCFVRSACPKAAALFDRPDHSQLCLPSRVRRAVWRRRLGESKLFHRCRTSPGRRAVNRRARRIGGAKELARRGRCRLTSPGLATAVVTRRRRLGLPAMSAGSSARFFLAQRSDGSVCESVWFRIANAGSQMTLGPNREQERAAWRLERR